MLSIIESMLQNTFVIALLTKEMSAWSFTTCSIMAYCLSLSPTVGTNAAKLAEYMLHQMVGEGGATGQPGKVSKNIFLLNPW